MYNRNTTFRLGVSCSKFLGVIYSVCFISLYFTLPPFLCRLEFISNQRASRELQLLITFSFAFLHINDCRVLVGFLPQWFKDTSVLCPPGRRGDGRRRGWKPSLSPLRPTLVGVGQQRMGGGGGGEGGSGGTQRGFTLGVKGQCP